MSTSTRSISSFVELLPRSHRSPLLWAVTDGVVKKQTVGSVTMLHRRTDRGLDKPWTVQLEAWLAEVNHRPCDINLVFECLAWCYATPRLAKRVPETLVWELIDKLGDFVSDATGFSLDEQPLEQQLLAGELSLALSAQMTDRRQSRAMQKSAQKALSWGLNEMLDGEGLPHFHYVRWMRMLAACWTRSLLSARVIKAECFSQDAQLQYEWLLRQILRLTRADGTQSLSSNTKSTNWREMFLTALHEMGDEDDWQIAGVVLSGREFSEKGSADEIRVPVSENSEWAKLSVLRRDWSRNSERLILGYADSRNISELEVGGKVIWSGVCNPQVTIDGRALTINDNWEEVCWISDDDGDYIELENRLNDEWTVHRQMFLARQDRFLYFADGLAGERTADIRYHLSLPLANGVSWHPQTETREGILKDEAGRNRCQLFPLALTEWTDQTSPGWIEMCSEQLVITQTAHSQRIYVPLFLDFDTRRMARERTWRQLTVAEQLSPVTPDIATGYRIHLGQQQWLIYRSLAPTASRTVLGQNLIADLLIGRFDRVDGTVQALVEIE